MSEIKVFTARAGATVLREIGPDFERETGHTINMILGVGPTFVKRINSDEPFDIIISGPSTIDGLIDDGKLRAHSRTNIFRSGLGVGTRSGALRPDISDVNAFKAALRQAKSIGYLRVNQVDQLIHKLGMTDDLGSKIHALEADLVSEQVATGELELGIVVITQILTTAGTDLVGPLPSEIRYFVEFVAGIGANSKYQDAAFDLLQFLLSPIAIPVIRAQGMEPG